MLDLVAFSYLSLACFPCRQPQFVCLRHKGESVRVTCFLPNSVLGWLYLAFIWEAATLPVLYLNHNGVLFCALVSFSQPVPYHQLPQYKSFHRHSANLGS